VDVSQDCDDHAARALFEHDVASDSNHRRLLDPALYERRRAHVDDSMEERGERQYRAQAQDNDPA
jgi:hypothetical protein